MGYGEEHHRGQPPFSSPHTRGHSKEAVLRALKQHCTTRECPVLEQSVKLLETTLFLRMPWLRTSWHVAFSAASGSWHVTHSQDP